LSQKCREVGSENDMEKSAVSGHLAICIIQSL
jgi:hypothetical protein